jgi:hypothetical protein
MFIASFIANGRALFEIERNFLRYRRHKRSSV